MAIEWREKFEIGNEIIDSDHKRLVDLLNKYEKAVMAKNPRLLKLAFDGLVDYAHTHFAREENLMLAVHYPGRASHCDEHRSLIAAIEDFHQSLENGGVALDKVSVFLHDWLIDHVFGADMKLKPYLQGGRQDYQRK